MSRIGNARDLRDRTVPHRSELAFQLKLGNLQEVPEPVSLSLFSVGVVSLAMAGLRRQQKI